MDDSKGSAGRSAVTRIIMLLCGTAGNAFIAFSTQLVLTRNVALSDYGSLAALVATVTLVTPLAGICIGWFWLELYGREGRHAIRWGPSALKLTGLSLTITVLLLGTYIFFSSNTLGGTSLFTWLCACIILLSQTLSETRAVRLQLEENFLALAAWQIIPQALRSIIVGLLAVTGALSGPNVLYGYALAGLFVSAVSCFSVVKMVNGKIRIKKYLLEPQIGDSFSSIPSVIDCLRAATPYCLVTLFFLIYSLGILALVELLISREAAAYYNVSYLIYTSLCVLPSVIYSKFLAAKIFRWWSTDRKMLIASFHLGVFFHLVVGIFLGFIVGFWAEQIIVLFFGKKYQPAVAVLQILAFAVPIRFIQHGYGSMLFSKEHIKRKVSYMGIAAMVSAFSMFMLAPRFGMKGAAISAVIAEMLLLVLYVIATIRYIEGITISATFRRKTLVESHEYVTGKVRTAI